MSAPPLTLSTDLTTTIEECYLSVSRDKWIIKRIYGNGIEDTSEYMHATLAVEATNGKSYFVDMGGAQFGQHRALAPFQDCLEQYSAKFAQVHPHGFYANEQKKFREGKQYFEGHMAEGMGGKYDYRIMHVQTEMLESFLNGVKKWETDKKMKVQQMVNCREAEFEELKTSLLRAMKEAMQMFLMTWKLGGCKVKAHPEKSKQAQMPDWMLAAQKQLAGPSECTVHPKGPGSGAYQQFKANKEARVCQNMAQNDIDVVEQFKAGGGHVFHV